MYVDAANDITCATRSICYRWYMGNHRLFVSVRGKSSKKGYARVLLNVVKSVQIREVSDKIRRKPNQGIFVQPKNNEAKRRHGRER